MGLFDGKVVAITGAGGGLGEAYAHAFAKEGAKVVVNDLGGARDGMGSGSAMADQVVAAIKEAGGEAAPNYDNVATEEGAENIVKTAVDAFGRLDILVNNAGILRDKTLVKMTEREWEPVLKVHLWGTYYCAKAAALQMLRQGEGGRIISTSSIAGLKGNFGQTNYGAAKAGIAGFTRSAAMELRSKGITVNAIGPIAKTRMTDDIDLVSDDARPEFIAPMVLFLASELGADVTGRVFGVHGNHIFEYVVEMTEGVDKKAEMWTPSEIADRFEDITKVEADFVREQAAKAGPAAAPTVDPAAKALAVLQAMATAFLPERAKSWKANLHFEIKGCGALTMTVADGTCAVSAGKEGEATCVVKMADDTFFGMSTGEIDGTQAFMQGKITATNMRDMVKWGSSFDSGKAQAAVKEALANLAPAASAGVDPATRALKVMEAMATALVPERAGSWKAVLHFEIKGCGDVTMAVADGAATVESGKQGEGTCVVKMSDDTFFGMAVGEVDGTQAFMQGKITATNMRDMVKWGTAFDSGKAQAAVKAVLAELEGGPAAAAPGEAAPAKKPEGLNWGLLHRRYAAAPFFVKENQTRLYAKATNDDNPYYVDDALEGGVIAPVLFPVRILYDIQFAAMLDPELNADLLMLLYGSQEMRFHAPIHPGDIIETKAEISKFEDKETGEIFDLKQWCMRDGEPVTEVTSRFFIRKPGAKRSKPKQKEEPTLPELLFSEPMRVRQDQTEDYALASKDTNPIHLDEAIARSAGLKGRILHGLCSMAFASQAVVKHACDGVPTRLRRLKVRFGKPIFLGDTVTTQAWRVDETEDALLLGFQVVNQDGSVVLTQGEAEVALQ